MTKYRILDILIKNKGDFISGEILSKKLNVSRTAIWKGVKSLKDKGYNITGVNNKGYCLMEDNNISDYEIKNAIKCKEIGEKILYFKQIDSTNTYLKKEAENLEHGCVVIAEEQIHGRAKNSKIFYSPKENGIYMSILLKKNIFSDSLKLLTLTVFLAVIKGIKKTTGLDVETDWNSILINNKKVAGILIECSLECDTNNVENAVIGIGINVNNQVFPKELKEKLTSLRIEKKEEINRKNLICNTLEEVEKLVCDQRYIFDRKKNILKYCYFFKFLNKNVLISSSNRKISGKLIEINEKGGVVILKENGKKEVLYRGIIKEI